MRKTNSFSSSTVFAAVAIKNNFKIFGLLSWCLRDCLSVLTIGMLVVFPVLRDKLAAQNIGDHCYAVDTEEPTTEHDEFLLLKEVVEKIKVNGWIQYFMMTTSLFHSNSSSNVRQYT